MSNYSIKTDWQDAIFHLPSLSSTGPDKGRYSRRSVNDVLLDVRGCGSRAVLLRRGLLLLQLLHHSEVGKEDILLISLTLRLVIHNRGGRRNCYGYHKILALLSSIIHFNT